MIDYKRSSQDAVTVSHAGKALAFRLDRLPEDWETLFRDPEVEQCVHEVVIRNGQPVAEGQAGGGTSAAGWDEVGACLDELRGSTG
jgi:hypothetical protein